MIETLKQIDTNFFLSLNSSHSPFWDIIMFWVSSKILWVPLYLFIVYSFFKEYSKKAIFVTLALIALVGIADLASVHLFKNIFLRYRPCHNIDLQDIVHLVNNKCGGMYGFVSSHATNAFVLVSFVSFVFKNKYTTVLAIFLGLIISYSRIYLGVHYPADILGGIILGTIIGTAGYFILKKILSL